MMVQNYAIILKQNFVKMHFYVNSEQNIMNIIRKVFHSRNKNEINLQANAYIKAQNISIGVLEPNPTNFTIQFCPENLEHLYGPYELFTGIVKENTSNFVFLLGLLKNGQLVHLHQSDQNVTNNDCLQFTTNNEGQENVQPCTANQNISFWDRLSKPAPKIIKKLNYNQTLHSNSRAVTLTVDGNFIKQRIIKKNKKRNGETAVKILDTDSLVRRMTWQYYTFNYSLLKFSNSRSGVESNCTSTADYPETQRSNDNTSNSEALDLNVTAVADGEYLNNCLGDMKNIMTGFIEELTPTSEQCLAIDMDMSSPLQEMQANIEDKDPSNEEVPIMPTPQALSQVSSNNNQKTEQVVADTSVRTDTSFEDNKDKNSNPTLYIYTENSNSSENLCATENEPCKQMNNLKKVYENVSEEKMEEIVISLQRNANIPISIDIVTKNNVPIKSIKAEGELIKNNLQEEMADLEFQNAKLGVEVQRICEDVSAPCQSNYSSSSLSLSTIDVNYLDTILNSICDSCEDITLDDSTSETCGSSSIATSFLQQILETDDALATQSAHNVLDDDIVQNKQNENEKSKLEKETVGEETIPNGLIQNEILADENYNIMSDNLQNEQDKNETVNQENLTLCENENFIEKYEEAKDVEVNNVDLEFYHESCDHRPDQTTCIISPRCFNNASFPIIEGTEDIARLAEDIAYKKISPEDINAKLSQLIKNDLNLSEFENNNTSLYITAYEENEGAFSDSEFSLPLCDMTCDNLLESPEFSLLSDNIPELCNTSRENLTQTDYSDTLKNARKLLDTVENLKKTENRNRFQNTDKISEIAKVQQVLDYATPIEKEEHSGKDLDDVNISTIVRESEELVKSVREELKPQPGPPWWIRLSKPNNRSDVKGLKSMADQTPRMTRLNQNNKPSAVKRSAAATRNSLPVKQRTTAPTRITEIQENKFNEPGVARKVSTSKLVVSDRLLKLKSPKIKTIS